MIKVVIHDWARVITRRKQAAWVKIDCDFGYDQWALLFVSADGRQRMVQTLDCDPTLCMRVAISHGAASEDDVRSVCGSAVNIPA